MIVSNTNTLSAFSFNNKTPKRERSFVSQLSNEIEKAKETSSKIQQEAYEKTKELGASQQPSVSAESQEKTTHTNTYKQTLTYLNAFAINQYETFHNLENQKAKTELLGFSAYA